MGTYLNILDNNRIHVGRTLENPGKSWGTTAIYCKIMGYVGDFIIKKPWGFHHLHMEK